MPDSLDRTADHRIRVRVFVDFWNFDISMRQRGFYDEGYKVDWSNLGPRLARKAGCVVDPEASITYQGMNVYGSYDPSNRKDGGLRRWMENTVGRFPGVTCLMLPRQRKREGPKCPSCHEEVRFCPIPECRGDMRGTEEKGVDTRIATDLISLAWDGNYDVAVLVSSDRDFVPVAGFLGNRGLKVIHGAFPPNASELTQACWGSIAIPDIRDEFRRA